MRRANKQMDQENSGGKIVFISEHCFWCDRKLMANGIHDAHGQAYHDHCYGQKQEELALAEKLAFDLYKDG
jgi:hypothetical protein